jgi:predicted amidophosphoribosyltransferase
MTVCTEATLALSRRLGLSLGGVLHWLDHFVAEPTLSVLFPPRCVGCGDFETHLCDRCRDTLIPVTDDSCRRCGEPGASALVKGRCTACLGHEMTHDGARSAFVHQGVAKRLVSEFKFGGQPVLGRVMAELALPAFKSFLASIPGDGPLLVTWVAAHPRAQRARGYNQGELLARRLARQCGLDCAGLVRKGVATHYQKGLGREQRHSNLHGAFEWAPEGRVALPGSQYGAIVLVDDVYTTGATAAELSLVIKASSGLLMFVFTFSRAISAKEVGHD